MKEKEIAVLMVEPGEHPVVTTLKNDLDSLQKVVSIGSDSKAEMKSLEKQTACPGFKPQLNIYYILEQHQM